MKFKKLVKSIQTAGYNVAHTKVIPEGWAVTVHTGYIEVIMQEKCGRNTETTFDIK